MKNNVIVLLNTKQHPFCLLLKQSQNIPKIINRILSIDDEIIIAYLNLRTTSKYWSLKESTKYKNIQVCIHVAIIPIISQTPHTIHHLSIVHLVVLF